MQRSEPDAISDFSPGPHSSQEVFAPVFANFPAAQ
jgi:hypothetical protein